jgi:hypothetical protein
MKENVNQAVNGPGKPKDPTPVSLQLKVPVNIGGGGMNVQQIDTGRANRQIHHGLSFDMDYERRVCWIRFDNGSGYVATGWTPFENLAAVNFGTVAKGAT